MKVTRALFLSSQNQAEAWEHEPYGIFRRKRYRYLIEDQGSNLRFCVFRVHQESEKGTVREFDVVAPAPHVEESFEDMGRLKNFLHRYQIDFEKFWEPVEPK